MMHSEIYDKIAKLIGFEQIIFNNTMNTKYQTRSAWIIFNDRTNCENSIELLKDEYKINSSFSKLKN